MAVSTWARVARGGALALLSLIALIAILVASNPAPAVPAIPDAEVADLGEPYVVKLHARWCPLCMMTRGVWSNIESTYAGRVRMVVFDFTSDETTRASEVEARRLGLGTVFDEYAGATGIVLVLNGKSKEVIGDLHGNRDFEAYRVAIDKALEAAD